MKVACYLRVSTEDQKTDLQKDAITKFLAFKGWHDAALFYIDQGESGSKISRPEFDRMMGDARAGKINAVLTWKFDRIGRSTAHLIAVMEELKTLNIDFISVIEAIDTTTAMGKMIFTIFAALAEFERETLIMRTKAGIKSAKERGTHCGRKSTVTDEERKDIIYLRGEGMSLDEICKTHPRLSPSTVYRVMRGK